MWHNDDEVTESGGSPGQVGVWRKATMPSEPYVTLSIWAGLRVALTAWPMALQGAIGGLIDDDD